MWLAVLLTATGIMLSAFFSGSETGFYRVTRVRLAIDAKGGQLVARALHLLSGKTSLVVATVLIGNNIANYVVSLGLVLLGKQILAPNSQIEAFLPVLMTPVLFIYGELLPKYLFYQVPYRLLRWGAPFMLLCTVMFLPVSIFVLVLESVWNWFAGNDNAKRGSSLERQELQRVLVEGQEAGVVLQIQRELAQNLFTYGARPIRQFVRPLRGIPVVPNTATRSEVLKLAQERTQPIVGVLDAGGKKLLGYHCVSRLLTLPPDAQIEAEPVWEATASQSTVQVFTQLQSQQKRLVQVVDVNQRVLGVITRERLAALLIGDSPNS